MTENISFDEQQWFLLQRQVAWLRVGLIVALLLIVMLGIALFTHQPATIRTHAISIVDAQGHDRILIGAPVPASADRTRKDGITQSIVFLSANGADRLIVGQSPSPARAGKSGKRMAEAYGLMLHDPQGNERGGVVFLGSDRAAVVLDRASPSGDAVALMVDDKTNFAGILAAYPGPVGGFDPVFKMGSTGDKAAFQIFDKSNSLRADLTINGPEKPEWKFDAAKSTTTSKP
jgi:hypothetical protein